METNILKKEVIKINKSGGEYISKKQFYIKNIDIDYSYIRFELFKITENLYNTLKKLISNRKSYINKIIKFDIDNNNDIKKYIKNIYNDLESIYNYCKIYNYDIIKNIDYKCKKISVYEKENLKIMFNNYDITDYKECIDSIYDNYILEYDDIIDKLTNNKFYLDNKKELNNYEIYVSSLLSYILNCSIEIDDREEIGYLLKLILNDYDYSLLRNILAYVYEEEELYNEIKKGKKKLIKYFDENKYDYRDDIVVYPYYDYNNDKKKIEEFEDKYISHYKEIIKIL